MNNIEKLRVFCHKVIPLVYDDSLSYYEVLCKTVTKMNEVIENSNSHNEIIETLQTSVQEQSDKLNEAVTKITADIETLATGEKEAREILEANLKQEIADLDTKVQVDIDDIEGTLNVLSASIASVTEQLSGYVVKSDIVQVIGSSTEKIMSQSAVNNALISFNTNVVANKLDKSAVVQITGTNTDKVMSQNTVTGLLDLQTQTINKKFDKSNIVQVSGANTDKVMSQKAVTDVVVLKSDIEQSSGDWKDKVMSQKATTDLVDTVQSYLNYSKVGTDSITQTTGDSESLIMSQKAVTDALASAGGGDKTVTGDSYETIQSTTQTGTEFTKSFVVHAINDNFNVGTTYGATSSQAYLDVGFDANTTTSNCKARLTTTDDGNANYGAALEFYVGKEDIAEKAGYIETTINGGAFKIGSVQYSEGYGTGTIKFGTDFPSIKLYNRSLAGEASATAYILLDISDGTNAKIILHDANGEKIITTTN